MAERSKEGLRYEYDMAQARLMGAHSSDAQIAVGQSTNNSTPFSSASFTTTTANDDYALGMKGLERAKLYQKNGRLAEALKLYELSIELLIRLLKSTDVITKDHKTIVEIKIHDALSDAEALKQQLSKTQTANNNLPPALTKQTSFQALSDAISSALQFASSRKQKTVATKKSPTHVAMTTASARQSTTVAQTSKDHRVRKPAVSASISSQHSEIRQMILSDFLMIPSNVPKTTWDEIAGLKDVKRSLQETAILPLLRPDLFTGLRRPQNILLYGPPGTGKTLLVKAVAYESQSNLFVCTSSAITSKWMGEAEKLVRELFAVAQALVPSIIFLDEVDALLSSRKESDHEASRRLKTEFMVQMDGIRSQSNDEVQRPQQHVLVIACTNCPWDVDSAILRRFPRRIMVPLPDAQARSGLIEYLLKKIGRHSITSSRQLARLVKLTEGFSGSDITAIASEASFGPLRDMEHLDAMKGCRADDLRPILLSDFENVIANTTKSVDTTLLERYNQWKQQQQH